jgi:flagellar L-ring protein precursor FlgH
MKRSRTFGPTALPPLALAVAAMVFVSGVAASGRADAASLYREETFRPLTADNKAFRSGDVLTVQILENSSATTNADTSSRRKNGLTADLTRAHIPTVNLGASVGGEFDGGGRTQRAGRLLAQITVSVQEVLPNGELRISGAQMLMINEEQQRIQLDGRVRPQDISDGNLVLSTRLADARITYVGEGDLSDRARRAWWRRFLDAVGL